MNWKPERYLVPVIDLALFTLAWVLAYSLRFDLSIPSDDSLSAGINYALQLKLLLPWVVFTHLALYWVFKLYKAMLRYTGSTELKSMGVATGIHLVIWISINFFLQSREHFGSLPQRWAVDGEITEVLRIPFGILVTYSLLTGLFTGAVRFLPRLVRDRTSKGNGGETPATLIVGAGDLADSLLRRETGDFRPVCAVTDMKNRVGLRLHNVPVVGMLDKISKVIEEEQIDLVLVALDDPTPERLRRVVEECEDTHVTFRIVPSARDISEGRVEVSSIRQVEIEDLLGREQVSIELPPERNYLEGQVVLITGAGGSIGSEMVRQTAKSGARKILLVGKGENSIFDIASEISRSYPKTDLELLIGDIRNADRMERIFHQHQPDIVFHAAAHKHVPLMERAPDEAVTNNVMGTVNIARLADSFGVKRFVLISSDKAVNPSSVMGATKRVAEMAVRSLAKESTTCCYSIVRFGNVMGSRGSVIPIFRQQIAQGGPVTVSDKDARRYFMTIPEAVTLVIQAGSREENGQLYLLDMGEPIKIADLARNMITISGFRPDVDIKVEYTGLRPGEKLVEDLTTEREKARKTEVGKLLATDPGEGRLWKAFQLKLNRLAEFAKKGQQVEVVALMAQLIEDYEPRGWDLSQVKEPLLPTVMNSDEVEPAPEPVDPESEELPPVVEEPVEEAGEEEVATEEPEVIAPIFEESDLFEEKTEEAVVVEESAVGEIVPGTFDDVIEPEEQIVEDESPAEESEESEEQLLDSEDILELDEQLSEEDGEDDSQLVDEQEEELEDLLAEDGINSVSQTEEAEGCSDELEKLEDFSVESEAEKELVRAESVLDMIVEFDEVKETDQETEKNPVFEKITVETMAVQKQASPTFAEESGDDTPRKKDVLEIMASIDPQASNSIVALRVSTGIEAETLAMLISQLQDKVLKDGDQLVALLEKEGAATVPQGVETKVVGDQPEGAVMAAIIESNPQAGMLLIMSSEVILKDDALDGFKAALADAPLVFSNFEENRSGKNELVQPHDHNGCPHERFEFGPVIAVRCDAIANVGGIRKDLKFAWEYDLHLKLMEKTPFKTSRETLYSHFIPEVTGKGSGVYSPGKGPLGGFSYVFYPEDMEKEITSVFEEALKRRGAWIDHPAVEVDHGGRNYEIMASVVIPILNRVKYISNAIEKVQSGTFDDFEVIVIDNGSTDGTIDLVKGLAEKDSRIKLLHGKGSSIASALNEGIRAARGKYICQLDSDDEYHPTCLEKMIGHLESHPKCGLAISYYCLMDENAVVLDSIPPVTHGGYTRNQILRRDGAGALRVFPKAVLQEFGFYDEEHYGNFGEDYDMVVKTGEKYDVDRVHEILYHYRRHSDNTDVTRDPAMKYNNKNRARQEALRRRTETNQKLGKS